VKRTLRLGISPCPNDTFVFHGLLERKVDPRGLDLTIELADVEELNQRLARGELDASKVSFAAALRMSDTMVVLRAGSALGRDVGPILLARGGGSSPSTGAVEIPRDARVLCPGEATTAHLLFRLFHPGEGRIEQVPFHEIIPALERGRADFGVCIHEARFTWASHGLRLVEDLGTTWATRTRALLPLGGIVARRELGEDVLAALDAAIQASLDYALSHRDEALATMRLHAREQSDDVLWAHVSLYVNEWTRELGVDGARALDELSRIARASGLLGDDRPPLSIFQGARRAQSP
jgi:1,4-dihydroxy-6-naphthoate synthase